MAKRSKRAKKAIESLRKQIEEHFEKLEQDVKNGNFDLGRYHYNEIDFSLLTALVEKIKIIDGDMGIVEEYRGKLERFKGELGL